MSQPPQQPKQRDGYYAGLCVGGPLASRRIAHHTTIYPLVKLPSVSSFAPGDENNAVDPNFKTGHYEFDRKAGIWWWRGTN
jgi:hypothetical protein